MDNFLLPFRNYLLEDSRGGIVNNLGWPRHVAERFHEASPKFAYVLAKVLHDNEYRKYKDATFRPYGPTGQFTDGMEKSVKKGWKEHQQHHWSLHAVNYFMNGPRRIRSDPDGVGLGKKMIAALTKYPHLEKEFKKSTFEEVVERVKLFEEEQEIVAQAAKKKVLTFPDGFYWADLDVNYCPYEQKHMGHCGEDDDGTLVSLRDPNHRPHVTMTWSKKPEGGGPWDDLVPDAGIILQARGKEDRFPIEKYWPYMLAFLKKTGADYNNPHEPEDSPFNDYLFQHMPIVRRKSEAGTFYYKGPKLHRDDGPAVIMRGGKMKWYNNGNLHRDGGPAATWPNGKEEYWQHGDLHRDDGPAVIFEDGMVAWVHHSKFHRFNGPAVYLADENGEPTAGKEKLEQYWVFGKKMNRDDYWEAVEAIDAGEDAQDFLQENKERIDPRIMKIINKLPDGVFVKIQAGRNNMRIVSYEGDKSVQGHVAIASSPKDSNDIEFMIGGECSRAYVVNTSNVNPFGYGALLYEVALEFASKHGGGLASDRGNVSQFARRVWDKYLARDDVQRGQLDVNKRQAEEDGMRQLTPSDPSDDCMQYSAVKTHGDKNWPRSSLAKIYRKDNMDVTNHLHRIGKLR